MSFSVEATFIDNFKIGDNINYNLEILNVLYDGYDKLVNGERLIKPIVLINTSIAEALLYDFIENRIRKANSTETIFEEILDVLRIKKLDKFEHYITQAEKYDFFNMKDTGFYPAMHSLKEKRNRIHIQNKPWKKPADEFNVFDEKAKILSEKVVEKILNTLTSYPRREEYHGYVKDFKLPWNRHFDATPLTLEEAEELGII